MLPQITTLREAQTSVLHAQFQQSFLRVPTATVLAFLRKTKNLHIPYPTTVQDCGSSILVTNSA